MNSEGFKLDRYLHGSVKIYEKTCGIVGYKMVLCSMKASL